MLVAFSKVTLLPLRKRDTSFPSLTARKPNVLGAIPLSAMYRSISVSSLVDSLMAADASGHLPIGQWASSHSPMGKLMGKKPTMDDGVRRRFTALMDASGVDLKTASLRAGLGATYVRDVIKKQRGKLENVIQVVERLAPSYVDWVQTGRGSPPPATLPPEQQGEELPFDGPVRILGSIGSGGVAHLKPANEQETLEVFAPPGTVALENSGISLGVGFKGWLVLYRDEKRSLGDDLIDRLCVVGTDDGRVIAGWVRRGGISGVQVVSGLGEVEADIQPLWASEVISIQPR